MNHPLSWLRLFMACALLACIGCKGEFSATGICAPSCEGKSCGDDGCGGSCGSCGPGRVCGADATCVSAFCGNGSLEANESCDPAITSGEGVCPTAMECADDGDACTREEFSGSPASCDAECKRFNIIACDGGDGCCPSGCGAENDADCATICGDGVVDPGETCDPPDSCPTEADCSTDDACSAPLFTGSADDCNAECAQISITTCKDGDGCCPQGCDEGQDDDCDAIALCGNGALDTGEACDPAIAAGDDGACPQTAADCDDSRACTTDSVTGAADDCSATCAHDNVTSPIDGDGCCPIGATDATDDDCPPSNLCGNGTLDTGEACDPAIADGATGACPTDVEACDDMIGCTVDTLEGDAASCTATCVHTAITVEVDDDGCCLPRSSVQTDVDCVPVCLTYCTWAEENCTGSNALYTDLLSCMPNCEPLITGDEGDQSGDTVYCRIHHLELAASDPATHCPHALPTSSACN